MKSGISKGSIDTFNFIFDVSFAWKITPKTGQRQVSVRSAPLQSAMAIEMSTLIRKEWIPRKDEEKNFWQTVCKGTMRSLLFC
ncbi:hypothetical protein [Serratia fonticola]